MNNTDQHYYSERVVAFIDILGFAALVRRLAKEPTLHADLHRALSEIKIMKDFAALPDTAQSNLQVSVFSDSIVISGASNDLQRVIWSAIHLQCHLLALGILVRGGISCGQTVHADDILYGQGMLDAYYLESKTAVYPRIVLDPKLLDSLNPGQREMFLTHDSDGLWFLDPFAMGIISVNVEAALDHGLDPHEESLKVLGKKIDQEVAHLSDVAHLAKWNWLKKQHSVAVAELAKYGSPRFWHIMKAAEAFGKAKPDGATTGGD